MHACKLVENEQETSVHLLTLYAYVGVGAPNYVRT